LTTKSQIRDLVAPLLRRNPDLVLVDKVHRVMITVVRPLQHLLRFVLVDRTGNADVFRPCWSLTLLFYKLDRLPIGGGAELYRSPRYRPALWWWSDPNVAQDFVEVVERDALPKLRAINTLHDYLDFIWPKDPAELKFYWGTRLLLSFAMGDLDTARTLVAERPDEPILRTLNERKPGIVERLVALGMRLAPDDRAAIAEMLREWEDYSVAKLNLGAVWEPTPFPLDREDAVQSR
jgi:hypothetical protein